MTRGGYTHGRRSGSNKPNELVPLSDDELQALRWFREREPVGYLDVSRDLKVYPTDRMRTHLTILGVIEQCPARGMELIKYRTTEKGRAALDAAAVAVTNGDG